MFQKKPPFGHFLAKFVQTGPIVYPSRGRGKEDTPRKPKNFPYVFVKNFFIVGSIILFDKISLAPVLSSVVEKRCLNFLPTNIRVSGGPLCF
jgi:hypothetical protein